MGARGMDLRTLLNVQLYPENDRKVLMSFPTGWGGGRG